MSKRIPLGIREASAAKIVADVQPLDWSLVRHIEKNVACAKAELAAATTLLKQLKTTGGDYSVIVETKLRRVIAMRVLHEAQDAVETVWRQR